MKKFAMTALAVALGTCGSAVNAQPVTIPMEAQAAPPSLPPPAAEEAAPAPLPTIPVADSTGLTTAVRAELFDRPVVEAMLLKAFAGGIPVNVLDRMTDRHGIDWCQVRIEGKTGWMKAKQIVSPAQKAP